MLDHREIEKLCIFQRAAEQPPVHYGFAIIGNSDDPRFHHFTDFGERFAFLLLRDGSDRKNQRGRRPASLGDDVRRNSGIVIGRFCVGHCRDSCETPGNGGRSSSSNGFGLFRSRFTKMDVDIEEARRDDATLRIELRHIGLSGLAYRTDLAIQDQNVSNRIDLTGRINHSAVLDQQIHELWPPSIRKRIAIRTATPAATWSRMTEYGPSATSVAISTPRFSGPGCMMMASGFARATLSVVRP